VSTPALDAVSAAGLDHRVVRHGPAGSLAEAAAQQGVEIRDVVKTNAAPSRRSGRRGRGR
jgi:Cys-tRNA(Pro)/Cys-tRNA(Cys) deacylase